ncbi:MAG: LytTR family transcriptional regulator [Erysipelothrix sp.]|nr:LytTR family transcriptional regulator [Erysipelothrix sp.]
MKIKVIVDDNHDPETITLTTAKMSKEIERMVEEFNQDSLLVTHRGSEFLLNVNDIYFFDVDAETVYSHLPHTSYPTKFRLYELEEILPSYFVRISKSTIVSLKHITSITRNLSTVREVRFHDSHKIVYCSRKYYPILKKKMEEKTL